MTNLKLILVVAMEDEELEKKFGGRIEAKIEERLKGKTELSN